METVCPRCGKPFERAGGTCSDPAPFAESVRVPRAVCPHCGFAFDPRRIAETEMLPPPDVPPSAQETLDAGPPKPSLRPEAEAGERSFARYRILGELGRGGMGIVYKTYDPKLKRIVALKVLLSGEAASGEEVERFFREAESAAKLHHPNIVPIHELDIHEGKHFFTMDFIEGRPLSKMIKDETIPPRRAVEMIRDVALAVHHAHEQGVIHRDLKPANILLTEDGRPMVTDFGLAKQVQADSSLTQSGSALGTPSYMAPEQARGEVKNIDARTDVYALGAVLYEMVAGMPPFVGATPFEIMEKVAYDDPIPPRTFSKACPADIETICLKCLEKDRSRRYASATDLAEDCRRFLDGEAIAARPASVIYRVRKKLARHRGVAVVATVGVVVLLALAAWSYTGIVRERNTAVRERDRALAAEAKEAEQRELAEEKRKEAETQRMATVAARESEAKQRKMAEANLERAERENYVNRIVSAQSAWNEGHVDRMIEHLKACPASFRCWEWGRLKYLTHLELVTLKGHGSHVWSVAFSPDGKRLASGSSDGTSKLWDAGTGAEVKTLKGHGSYVFSVAFSPDGERLASGSGDKTIKLWDVETGAEVLTLKGHRGNVSSVAFSPDGKRLASGSSDGTSKLWDAGTGAEVLTLKGHGSHVWSVAFSPDGKRLASGGFDRTIKLWDVETGAEVLTLKGHRGNVSSVAFSPDGKRLASGSRLFPAIKLWDAETGREIMTLKGPSRSLAFGPHGRKIACGGGGVEDNTVRIWQVQQRGTQVMRLKGHWGPVYSVAFSPNGRRIASGSSDGTARIWDARRGRESMVLCSGFSWHSTTFSPDGKRIAAALGSGGVGSGGVAFWHADGNRVINWGLHNADKRGAHMKGALCMAYSPDGKRIAFGNPDGTAQVLDAETGSDLTTLRGHAGRVSFVAFSPDGERMASGGEDKAVRIWNPETGHEVMALTGHRHAVHSGVFSPDGKRIASQGEKTVRIWDAETGQEIVTLKGHTGWNVYVRSVSYGPDGKQIATAGEDKTIKIWDAETGRDLMTLKGHNSAVMTAAFSPDGKRIVSGGEDNTVRIWDAESGRQIMTLDVRGCAMSLAFSPDGRRLVVCGTGGVRIYEADPWWEPGNPPVKPKPVTITPKPVPKARPAGAVKDGEQF